MTSRRQRESVPATVPFRATPADAPPPVAVWANATIWTDRMLAALLDGVRGGKWHTLGDKVFRRDALEAAAAHVVANRGAAGVDHVTANAFQSRLSDELDRLEASLAADDYRPQAIRRTEIPKPGSSEGRPLGIPTVRDRVVQTALKHVLEPIFDVTFHEHSYGFRPGRSCHQALERVEELLEAGYVYVVDADLKSFFETIPHDGLLARMGERISDSRVLRWIEAFLRQDVVADLAAWTPERGTPQGAVISPLLANVYLNPLDHRMADAGFEMVRYADDFVILCRDAAEAERALEAVRAWVEANGLTLHPEKTRVADARDAEGFQFLGYWFKKGRIRDPRPRSLRKLKDALRPLTKRTNGRCLQAIIQSANPVLRGWFGYFRHCHWNVYTDIDGWLRMRLRSVLRKRRKRRGKARGRDHQRWPNSFFGACGLWSLEAAHREFRQSSAR